MISPRPRRATGPTCPSYACPDTRSSPDPGATSRTAFLLKPFPADELIRQARALLDAAHAAGASPP